MISAEDGVERENVHKDRARKAALTLIYISRNTAARGGWSTGLWDALTEVPAAVTGGVGVHTRERKRKRERERRQGGIWRSADYAEQTWQLAEKAKTFTNRRGGERGEMRGVRCDGEGGVLLREEEKGVGRVRKAMRSEMRANDVGENGEKKRWGRIERQKKLAVVQDGT